MNLAQNLSRYLNYNFSRDTIWQCIFVSI